MIKLIRITDIASSEYRYTEELLTATFPREEYRDLDEQRKNTIGNKNFHLMLATENNRNVGFINYWELGEFCYVEHLATQPALRGKGIGLQILEQLKMVAEKIVLEVEEPIDELTNRRIKFYQRAGFDISPLPYRQPPYRAGDGTLPMRLMFCGCPADEAHHARAKENIYNYIYNYTE